MREILFRGKRVDDGQWVEGYYYKANYYYRADDELCDYIAVPHPDKYNRPNSHFFVDPETIGQYTGLTDKNGKKIFEGDIIRYADLYDYYIYLDSVENPEVYDKIDEGYIWTIDEVVYAIKDGYPAFDLNKHDFEVNGLSELSKSGQYFYEVIGNIHDNKLEDFEDGN